jgi:ABC-type dipeptide/oligopeptide/nickel transport system permease subunit
MLALLSFFRKLILHKSLLSGIILILIALVVAMMAYVIAPDNSPNANRMILEIGGKKPGYRQLFLKIHTSTNTDESFMDILFSGKTDAYEWIPITGYVYRGKNLIVDKYIDDGITEKRSYPTESNNIHDLIEEKTFILGTDKFGRDILSRLIIGTRVSLGVGLIAVILSLTIGILLGAFAGYWGGRTDHVITWMINVVWSIPTILLVLGVIMLLGKGYWQVFLAIGLSLWVNIARLVRGQVFSVKEQSYVEAASIMGFSHYRILFKHILPNIMGPVWVMAAANFATAIMLEAGLSFLGIGIPPPQPSWGLMMKEHYNFIITNNPMLAIIPGMAIMLLVLAFHLVGSGLRDLLDVRSA